MKQERFLTILLLNNSILQGVLINTFLQLLLHHLPQLIVEFSRYLHSIDK